MITGYERFEIPDKNKDHSFTVDVNWDEQDKATNECKMLRFTFPNGDEALVEREHLMAVLFAIGDDDQQRKLIPQKIQVIRKYQTVLGIKATKDIKAGEMINVPVDIPLPPIEDEIMGEARRLVGTGVIKQL